MEAPHTFKSMRTRDSWDQPYASISEMSEATAPEFPLQHGNSLKGGLEDVTLKAAVISQLTIGNWPKVLSPGPGNSKLILGLTISMSKGLEVSLATCWYCLAVDGFDGVVGCGTCYLLPQNGSNPWFLSQWQSPGPLLCTAHTAAHLMWRWWWHCRLEHGCGKAGGRWGRQVCLCSPPSYFYNE